MKYMVIILVFCAGCAGPLKKIDSQRAEKTRQGVEALGVLFSDELSGQVAGELAEPLARAGALVNGLQILWGIPNKSISVEGGSIEKWTAEVKETKIAERTAKEKLLSQKLKERAKVGGEVKLGFLALGFLGLVIGTLYVRFQYGKLAAWVLGIVGGAVLIGYTVITYKVLILYGGLAIAALAIVYLGFTLYREGKFSKRTVGLVQMVRERLQDKHPGAAQEVDFVLTTGQREPEKKKIRRLKRK